MKTIFKFSNLLLSFLLITSMSFGAAKPRTPIITSMTPVSGYIGTTVTLNGSNFSNVTAVKIGTVAQSFRIVSGSKITFTVGGGTSTGIVYITNPYGTVNGATFAVINPLTITSVTPTSGPIGTDISITGTGFTQVNSVKINGMSVAYSTASSTKITLIVPPNTTSGPITMTDGYGNTATGPTFIVTSSTAPFVYSTLPFQGPPGYVITVSGNNFLTTTSVTIGGVPVNYTIINNTTLTCNAPMTPMFNASLIVTNPYGWHVGVISVIITQPAVITSVTPTVVPINGTVTMIGHYFSSVSQIYIGGVVVPAFSTWSDTLITFLVTNNLPSGWMTVVNPYGTTSGPYMTITAALPRIRDTFDTSNFEYYDMMGRPLGNDYYLLPYNQIIIRRNDDNIDRIIKQ